MNDLSRDALSAKPDFLLILAVRVLGARSVRAAALFCPLVEEPEREAGPAAMGHPPWGSEHGLYVVVVNAGGALMGREPQLQLPVHMRLKVHN